MALTAAHLADVCQCLLNKTVRTSTHVSLRFRHGSFASLQVHLWCNQRCTCKDKELCCAAAPTSAPSHPDEPSVGQVGHQANADGGGPRSCCTAGLRAARSSCPQSCAVDQQVRLRHVVHHAMPAMKKRDLCLLRSPQALPHGGSPDGRSLKEIHSTQASELGALRPDMCQPPAWRASRPESHPCRGPTQCHLSSCLS